MKMIENDEINIIVTRVHSRLSRNSYESSNIYRICKEKM
ncbi:hypothetical protein DRW41_05035 [Neobacillus piezotolerans]|uniref:Uncharacterized protein n=1 Tax=Neobacillus piezotolerans TaxID=2259171 RepID=A0A3D8GX06_9BACI|nr:hypothetical protein DRW41_05035 [Neobacillus piezotolerans]